MSEVTFELPQCPQYHPMSELNGRSGYYPNISHTQYQAAQELRQLCINEGYDVVCQGERENEFLKLLRFSRARQFDAKKSFHMLREDIEWRQSLADLKYLTAQEVLQCDMSRIYKYFPSWVSGKDRQLRPVAWRKFGLLEMWEITKITSIENLVRFHAWEAEQAIRLMYDDAASTGYNIETFVIVIDAAHWHIGLATSDAFKFIQGMVSTDSDHYPERLGACIIINAPSMLSMAWRVIVTFMDEVTKKKVKILSSQAEWLPVLLEVMDEDQIPIQFGGTHPDPEPARAFDTMNPPPRPEGPPPSVSSTKSPVNMKFTSIKNHNHDQKEIKSSNGWYDWLAIQKLDNNSVICNADEGQEYSNRKGIKVVDISSQCDDEMTLPSVQVIAEKEGVVKRQYSLVESPLRSSKHEQLNEEVVTVTASETSDGKQPCIVS